jgi:tetratricopeptide (TPR) repeat protein
MNKLIIIVAVISLSLNVSGNDSLKEKAIEEFKKEHYDNAIDFMKKAAEENPKDAEIYYYLGWFNHYRAYDSRPLKGFDSSYSKQVFMYLDKALELDPGYGDAKYFYGAECSANAIISMQNPDVESVRHFYSLANQKGAYPDWLKEFGRNLLSSCSKNSILFAGGNPDFDVCFYLQLHEKYRTDITLIPIGFIDRPWYVRLLKDGLQETVKPVEIDLTEQQIMDVHPFKWRSTKIPIQVSIFDKKQYSLPNNYCMEWEVKPDLYSNRMHSKMDGEEASKREYLSPQRAVLLQIIEDNFDKRPIFFSKLCSNEFLGGLDAFFQSYGLVSRLIPVDSDKNDLSDNYIEIQKLLVERNLTMFKTIKDNDLPRISVAISSVYYRAILQLLNDFKIKKDSSAIAKLEEVFENNMKIDYNEKFESYIMNEFKK